MTETFLLGPSRLRRGTNRPHTEATSFPGAGAIRHGGTFWRRGIRSVIVPAANSDANITVSVSVG